MSKSKGCTQGPLQHWGQLKGTLEVWHILGKESCHIREHPLSMYAPNPNFQTPSPLCKKWPPCTGQMYMWTHIFQNVRTPSPLLSAYILNGSTLILHPQCWLSFLLCDTLVKTMGNTEWAFIGAKPQPETEECSHFLHNETHFLVILSDIHCFQLRSRTLLQNQWHSSFLKRKDKLLWHPHFFFMLFFTIWNTPNVFHHKGTQVSTKSYSKLDLGLGCAHHIHSIELHSTPMLVLDDDISGIMTSSLLQQLWRHRRVLDRRTVAVSSGCALNGSSVHSRLLILNLTCMNSGDHKELHLPAIQCKTVRLSGHFLMPALINWWQGCTKVTSHGHYAIETQDWNSNYMYSNAIRCYCKGVRSTCSGQCNKTPPIPGKTAYACTWKTTGIMQNHALHCKLCQQFK